MSELQTEQNNEAVAESTDQSAEQISEETQQASTGEQVDTSHEIKTNGSEVGLSKKQEEESSEPSPYSSDNINGLIEAALNGELTDEQRASIDEDGLGQHFDMIVNGHKAEIAKNDAEIVGVAGGQEAYTELQEWAVSNLDDSEIDAFNRAVLETGDIGIAKLAVEGLQARYQRANGQAPNKIIEAGGTSNESNRPYNNVNDYINETMSMKYRQDPEYAAQVEAKRNLSGF